MSWYTVCYNKQYCGEKAMQSRYMLKLRAKQILVSVKPSPLFAGMMLTAISFLIYIFQYSGSGNTYAELINSGVRYITKLSEALVYGPYGQYRRAGAPSRFLATEHIHLLRTCMLFLPTVIGRDRRTAPGNVPAGAVLPEIFPSHDHHLNSCRHRHAVFLSSRE